MSKLKSLLNEMREQAGLQLNEEVSEEKKHKDIKKILDRIVRALQKNGINIIAGSEWKDSSGEEGTGQRTMNFRTGVTIKRTSINDILNIIKPVLGGYKVTKRDDDGFLRLDRGHIDRGGFVVIFQGWGKDPIEITVATSGIISGKLKYQQKPSYDLFKSDLF